MSTSRERMLAALQRRVPDHVPCAPMIFGALKARCRDYAEFVEKQLALGLDAFVELPPRPPVVANDYYNLHGLPVRYDERVQVREWIEPARGEVPVMIKEYHTPSSVLRTEVRQTPDWRWGNHVPLFDDYLVPRTNRFLVTRARTWRLCSGGVNGYITVEGGEEPDVRQAVRRAMETLSADGGFILSPVENLRVTSARAWSNTLAMIDEWKRLTGQ